MSQITRRAALRGVTVGGVLGAPAVLRAQGQVRLTLGHGQTPGNPRSVAADRMAAQLRERTTAASRCGSPARSSSAATSPC